MSGGKTENPDTMSYQKSGSDFADWRKLSNLISEKGLAYNPEIKDLRDANWIKTCDSAIEKWRVRLAGDGVSSSAVGKR